MDNNYKVYVRSLIFNHAPYIMEALRGFVMQETNFPFIVSLEEDCSTDNTRMVIENFLQKECDMTNAEYENFPSSEVIKVRHRSNKNCTFVVYFFKFNHFSKRKARTLYTDTWRGICDYEALCEGDDYWTDPLKLQKQVDFMDTNPDYVMCFHNAMERWEDEGGREQPFSNIENRDYVGVEMYRHWIVPTASVLFRHNEVYPSKIYKTATSSTKFIFGDIILFLSAASLGKVRGMSDCMSVYRRTGEGVVMKQITSYEKSYSLCDHNLEIFNIFGNEYKKDAEFLFHCHCIRVSKDAKRDGKKNTSIRFRNKSISYSYLGHYKTFLILIIMNIVDYMRSKWHIDFYRLRRIIKKNVIVIK